MRFLCFGFGLVVFTALGCGGGGTTGVNVTGKATLDGQPLSRGEVVLAADQGDIIRQGTITKDGTFSVPDIPPGKYKVALRIDQYSDDDYDVGERGKKTLKKTAKPMNVPAVIQDPNTSKMTVDVASGQEVVVDFHTK